MSRFPKIIDVKKMAEGKTPHFVHRVGEDPEPGDPHNRVSNVSISLNSWIERYFIPALRRQEDATAVKIMKDDLDRWRKTQKKKSIKPALMEEIDNIIAAANAKERSSGGTAGLAEAAASAVALPPQGLTSRRNRHAGLLAGMAARAAAKKKAKAEAEAAAKAKAEAERARNTGTVSLHTRSGEPPGLFHRATGHSARHLMDRAATHVGRAGRTLKGHIKRAASRIKGSGGGRRRKTRKRRHKRRRKRTKHRKRRRTRRRRHRRRKRTRRRR